MARAAGADRADTSTAATSRADASISEPAVVDSVLSALMSIGRLMRQRVAGESLDQGTFWLLKSLAGQGSMRLTELAGCANLDTSTISRHVTHLHGLGLVERAPDPDDGRAQRVELTPAGRGQLHSALSRRRALLTRSLQGWDETDIDHLDQLLARFVGDLETLNAELEHA